MTGTPLFDTLTGDMRNSRGRYNFDDRIRYGTIEEEKKTSNDDATLTAQASASASTAASGGERGGVTTTTTTTRGILEERRVYLILVRQIYYPWTKYPQ